MTDAVAIAWHYTVGARAADILRDGFIRAATEGVPAGELPIVWFSTRQVWEPTATKGYVIDGVRREATMREMIEDGDGLWRFGIPVSGLLAWGPLQQAAGMTRETARRLARAAQRQGADQFFWYGTLAPVAVDRCAIQCIVTLGDEWGGLPTSGAKGPSPLTPYVETL
jgi:hypothetical protein